MKRVIVSIISVILLFVMGLSIIPLSYFARPDGYNLQNVRGLYSEKNNTLDVVYIGGSACFVYWEPLRAWNQYGFTSYNFAHDTMTPQAIKNYIIETRKTQNPELFIIDARPFQYGDLPYSDSVEELNMYYEVPIRNGTDGLNFSTNRINLVNRSVKNWIDRISYYFDILKYNRNIVKNTLDSFLAYEHTTRCITNNYTNPLKGFYFVGKTEEEMFTDYSTVTESDPIDVDVDKILVDLLDYCKEENLRVLFVVHSYCQQEEHKKRFNYVRDKVEEYGYDFLNTNDDWQEVGLDYSFDLYNENHVNVFGAEKYTDYLSKYIVNHYQLPDHRTENGYDEWNTLYRQFEEKTEEAKMIIEAVREEHIADE